MFSGEIPFAESKTSMRAIAKVRAGDRPARPANAESQGLSDVVWDLITRAWSQSPQDRPTASAIAEILSRDV